MTEQTMIVAYVGRRLHTNNRLVYAYALNGDESFSMGKPLVPGCKIGTEIQIVRDGKMTYTGGDKAPVVVGQTEDDAAVLAWSAEEASVLVLHERTKTNAKMAKMGVDPLREALDVVAQGYNAVPRYNVGARAAFIDYVTAYIQGVR